MSSVKQQAIRAFRRMVQSREPRRDIQRGILGDGNGNVRLTDRQDRCYVRLSAADEAQFTALSLKVEDIENLPVLLRRTETGLDWEVYDVDYSMLTNVGDGWKGKPRGVPPHHKSHEWPDGAAGGDAVNVYPRALSMLRTYRKDGSSLTVRVSPLRYTYGGELKEFTGAELLLYTYQPAVGQARYVVTYLDPITNASYGHPGKTTVDSAAVVPSSPALPDFAVPSALVRLSGTKTYLSEPDFVDYRLLLDQVETPLNTGLVTTAHTHAKIVSSDGVPDPAWSADAAGDVTAVGNIILSGTSKSLKGTGSNYPNLGSLTDSEKLGHVYLTNARDILPRGDLRGLATRWINPLGLAITDEFHFRTGAIPTDYTWLNDGTFSGDPTGLAYSYNNEYLRGRASGAGNRHFMQKAVTNAAASWQNKYLYGRFSTGLTTEMGLRFDIGNDTEYAEVYADGTAADGTYSVTFRYRLDSGAVTTVTSMVLLTAGRMIEIALKCNWTGSIYQYGGYLLGESGSGAIVNIVGFIVNATPGAIPAAGRAGLMIKNTGTNAYCDWLWSTFT